MLVTFQRMCISLVLQMQEQILDILFKGEVGQVQILTDTLIQLTNRSINMVKEIIVIMFHNIFNELKVSSELTFNFLYIQKYNKYKKN